MKEQLISFETAKLAKEKGFNIVTNKGYYCHDTNKDYTILLLWVDSEEGEPEFGFAPTQPLLQKWLRDIHNIHIQNHFINNSFYIRVKYVEKGMVLLKNIYQKDTYEEALEEGLQDALKLIK